MANAQSRAHIPPPKLMLITPEVAAVMLQSNKGNRRLRPAFVKYLAEQIRRGEWHRTTDAIGIRVDGRIANGQHRLAAIVEAGIPAEAWVIEGVTDAEFMVLDNGIKRGAADALQISGHLAADAALISHILGRSYGHRVAVDVQGNIALWWQPIGDALTAGTAANPKGLSNAAVRLGAGLQWAKQTDTALQVYVHRQFAVFMRGDITSLSNSVGWLWKRQIERHGFYGSLTERMALAGIAYHVFDPARRDMQPRVVQETVASQVREELLKLEAAAGLGPSPPKETERKSPPVRRRSIPPSTEVRAS